MHELPVTHYQRARALFAPLRYQLFCQAVLAGSQPGRVFVDNPDEPHSGLLITRDVWAYLAGDPHNAAFNQALGRAIAARDIFSKAAWGLLFSCQPQEWPGLPAICRPRQLIELPRRHYLARKINYDWRANVPAGFEVRLVERALLEHAEIPEDVENLIKMWDAAVPEQRGFGFVALYAGKIVAHAVIDCIVDDAGDIGLVTNESFQRRGLAAVCAAATIEHGLNNGLKQVLWDCGQDNLGSIRSAEKLGLEFQGCHKMYLLDFG